MEQWDELLSKSVLICWKSENWLFLAVYVKNKFLLTNRFDNTFTKTLPSFVFFKVAQGNYADRDYLDVKK